MDRIHMAKRLLIIILLSSALCMASVTVDGVFRSETPDTINLSLHRDLGFPDPALVSSGKILRHPVFFHAGVDLRFMPTLPIYGTDPALLLIPDGRAGARP